MPPGSPCPIRFRCAGFVDECGTSATDGYTEDYVPSAGTSLAVVYESDLIVGEDTDQIGTLNSLDCSLYIGGWLKVLRQEVEYASLHVTDAVSHLRRGFT